MISNGPDFYIYQFIKILFGCSPFLLNRALKHHFQSNWILQNMFKKLILEKLLQDLYMDDLITYLDTEKLAFSIRQNSKSILAPGRFGLCKWFTNSS